MYHYRDSNDLEVDAVIQLDGTWAAFEITLNPNRIDKGSTALKRLAQVVNTESWGKPACLGVVTSTGYAYQHPDGIMVIPIGALAP